MSGRLVSSPFDLDNRGLPPSLVLATRLLAVTVIWRGDWPFLPYLPYLEVIDGLGSPAVIGWTLRLIAGAGCAIVLVTPFVRTGAALTGAALLTGLLACRPCQSVAHTYLACAFIMLSLSDRQSAGALLRAQVIVLYLGAAFNKVADPDWWNGRYFETLMITRHQEPLYASAASLLPPLRLSQMMGIATIAVQVGLSWLLATHRLRVAGVVFGLVFHSAMVLLLNKPFGPFFLAMAISYLAFVPWTPRPLATPAAYAAVILLGTNALGGTIRNVTILALLLGLGGWIIVRRRAALR